MNPKETVQLIPYTQQSFKAGINTANSPELLKDDEAVDILNFEYDLEDHLRSRSGVQRFFTNKFSNRITSLHYYSNDLNDSWVLATSGSRLYANTISSSIPTDITNSLVLPNNVFWQWVNYAGMAIGVNQATTGDNPIKVEGSVPNVAALGGTPPKGKYIVVWNERVWIVSVVNPNTIYASKLGDPEDWTDVGADGSIAIDIGKNDGDEITGIHVFQGALFVFKRKKIYRVAALEGTNPYDAGNLYAEEYSSSIGCVSPYSIKSILNDVLFLSDSGVCSLVSAPLGELKTIYLSQNVKEIHNLRKVSNEISAYVCEEAQQYWLMVPSSASTRGIFETFVFDYRNIQSGLIRWIRFDGLVSGTVAETIYSSNQRITIIGSQDNGVYFYRSGVYDYSTKLGTLILGVSRLGISSEIIFNDAGTSYLKQLISKAINFGLHIIRKEYHRFAFDTTLLSNDLKLTFRYYFDKQINLGDQYEFNYNQIVNEFILGVDILGIDKLGSDRKFDFVTIRQFKRNTKGRKHQNVTIWYSNHLNQGFVLREMIIYVKPLNHRQANEIGKIT